METFTKVDGKLEITTTGEINIVTKTKKELEGEKAEIQTKIDHLEIDLSVEQLKIEEKQTKINLL